MSILYTVFARDLYKLKELFVEPSPGSEIGAIANSEPDALLGGVVAVQLPDAEIVHAEAAVVHGEHIRRSNNDVIPHILPDASFEDGASGLGSDVGVLAPQQAIVGCGQADGELELVVGALVEHDVLAVHSQHMAH